jgi:hypothetical protein
MDQQPKPPPIYVKAAEQHRLAERMGKEAAGREKADKEASATTPKPTEAGVVPSATRPVAPQQATTTQPAKPFIPPELQPR